MGGLAGKGLPKLQILRIALIASCVGAFELTHANPRMRLQRRAAIAVNARPLIMGRNPGVKLNRVLGRFGTWYLRVFPVVS